MSGFNIAVSGIRAASSALDVTGNNIANASTTGFKSSRTEFADIYATSSISSGSNIPGSGVLVSDIAQDFSGGTVTFTNNNLDLSIDGSGFFQLDDGNGNVSYTRDGSFELDKDGFIVSKGGVNLQGYDIDDEGNRLPITDLAVTEKTSEPEATTEMSLSFNIDEANDAEGLSDQYSRTDAGSYTFSTTVGTFDSLGNEHTIRYDMVEQQARKEVHTFELTTGVGSFSIAGEAFNIASFGASNSLRAEDEANSTEFLSDLQDIDPRIFDVKYDPTASPAEIQVIFKSEASEFGDVSVTGDVENESIDYIDSNESHTFLLGAGPFTSDLAFEVAGVNFNLSADASNPLTQEDVANEIIAQETSIRDADPTIESIAYDSTDGLTFTFRSTSGDISSDTAVKIDEPGTAVFFTGTVDATTGFIAPDTVIEGDNSYQGVYRMYAYLNPLGQEPEALDIGKLTDPTSATASTASEIGPIIIKFDPSSGVLTEVNGETASTISGVSAPLIEISKANPADDSTVIELDITGTTQFADDQIVNSTSQNGFTKGDLTGVSFASNGEMTATYSNNQNVVIGIVAIATFENQAGLQPSGDNQWLATNDSGGAILNPPGTGLNGSLRSSALESSNVDLSGELVKLIEYQRNFQASSQTLETLNTVTQTILQI
jgi:flagellar hook protein FlgE